MSIAQYNADITAFKSYIKRKLGDPVVDIEITDEQLDDLINDTLLKYVEQATDGTSLRWKVVNLTDGVFEYDLGFDTQVVLKVYEESGNKYDIEAVFPDKMIADSFGSMLQAGDIMTYDLTKKFLEQLNFMFTDQMGFDFNSTSKKLYLTNTTGKTKVGVLYYQILNYSDSSSSIYSNQWIRDYAVAMAKYQWGFNLLKYEGSILPEGMTINASAIMDEGKQEIEKLDLDLFEKHTNPPLFFMG